MAMKKKPTRALKRIRKKWVKINSNKAFFKGQEIGETYTANPANVIGKVVKVNLMNLTGDPKKQSFSARFKVTKSEDAGAEADFIGYAMSNSQAKRMVRRATDKVEDSFLIQTKDNATVRIKPVLVTRNSTNKSVLTALRKKSKEFITERSKATDYTNLVSEILTGRLQKDLRLSLKKIYPTNIVEIKALNKI
jgi:ribosomal protein S3AE